MSSVTEQIKERIDIVELISSQVSLRKSGRNFVGFCPFHTNTNTPAFYVFPDTQSYHCFGCKASGTVFDFVMQREGIEFRGALEQLAQRAGVQLRERTEDDIQHDRLRTRLLDIHQAAAAYFHHMLVKSPRGEAAREYVAKRNIDQNTLEAFQLGYSPNDWGALLGYLTDRKGFEIEEIEAAGLAIRHETRGYFDRFRDRLMFPIRNAKGEIIAFGGRSLGDGQPKYMNSPQTELFDKSQVLYGLDLARESMRSSASAVIVEGYVDVIIAHQHGFRNVVAPLGTALTAEHVGVLKKQVRTVYLALDADPAGIRATLKGVQTLSENLDGHDVAVPTGAGMIRWERELDTVIKIISMPDGKDPDEVIRANPDQWRALVEGAKPVMDFYITALTADLDLSTARGKADAVERLAPLLIHIANPVEQTHYIQQIAQLVRSDEQTIRQALPTSAKQKRAARPNKLVPPPSSPHKEDYLLGWLLRFPNTRNAVIDKLKRDLENFPLVQEFISGEIVDLLKGVSNRAIWREWLKQSGNPDPLEWAETLDEELQAQLQYILQLNVPEPQQYRYVNDALECATILQHQQALQWKDRLKQRIADADGDQDAVALLEQMMQVKEYLDSISTPRRSTTYPDLHRFRTV